MNRSKRRTSCIDSPTVFGSGLRAPSSGLRSGLRPLWTPWARRLGFFRPLGSGLNEPGSCGLRAYWAPDSLHPSCRRQEHTSIMMSTHDPYPTIVFLCRSPGLRSVHDDCAYIRTRKIPDAFLDRRSCGRCGNVSSCHKSS